MKTQTLKSFFSPWMGVAHSLKKVYRQILPTEKRNNAQHLQQIADRNAEAFYYY